MATAQARGIPAVVFPKTIATGQQSLLVVKRLLALAVSCITYLRGIFPESAYGTRFLDDVSVKILREDKNSPGSTQLVKWMLGCYDALQKKYVRGKGNRNGEMEKIWGKKNFCFFLGIFLIFSKEKPDSSISCADTKRASILLIRKIFILMQNLSPLPKDVCLTMKLLYYDEVTPADYQPPGFREARCEGLLFQEEPTHLNVGEVPTPFHLLRLRISTERGRLQDLELPAPAQVSRDHFWVFLGFFKVIFMIYSPKKINLFPPQKNRRLLEIFAPKDPGNIKLQELQAVAKGYRGCTEGTESIKRKSKNHQASFPPFLETNKTPLV
uniref:HORMA domain-containing protein n=1 Tax=Malurus cyaneus samueli TaxID=2593467 RepID=A0A8C5TPY9_9PASS